MPKAVFTKLSQLAKADWLSLVVAEFQRQPITRVREIGFHLP
ncbi:MAG: hypothetical protein ABJA66_14400 [Actinomycetota bacterium]